MYSQKYKFTLRSFASHKTSDSLVKHTDTKAAWVCEMLGKNKRCEAREGDLPAGSCLIPLYIPAVCKTSQSSVNKKHGG